MSTATISAQEINKLRQATGAGMMDCRKALTETNGDFEAAIDWLRKQGQKVAAKRSDREAKEGVVIAQTTADNKRGVLLVVNCETDFVAKKSLIMRLSMVQRFQTLSMINWLLLVKKSVSQSFKQ